MSYKIDLILENIALEIITGGGRYDIQWQVLTQMSMYTLQFPWEKWYPHVTAYIQLTLCPVILDFFWKI